MRLPRVLILVTALLVAGCGGGGDGDSDGGSSSPTTPPAAVRAAVPTAVPNATLTVTSSAFTAGGQIPNANTCHAAGYPPPLDWDGDLRGAQAVAVVVYDPDAPGGDYVHWVVYDLPPGTRSLSGAALPAGTKQALNSGGTAGWTPPCPPSGEHHYHFVVYALRSPTGLADAASFEDARRAITNDAVAWGELVGTVANS
ncbi:YbhB/YbcL family Raf kinase inhibitor-like protein [Rugosimonospora africana]|uniref:YbhB/YbcL family Raf kinase inhibitor-like protein n=1 Tax=Rugosimonospora africana TaxID=556532 RepID=UPI0019432FD6|nr:YbhB/YbcL family Raf kinase inhibitor-like protein [Rugosimonospora africana]